MTAEDRFQKLDGLAEVRASCPPGCTVIGPSTPEGVTVSVNGQITAVCARKDGSYHGPSVTWYADGTKASAGWYAEGERVGEWVYWHENGQMSGLGGFHDGKAHGKWVTWHDNGERSSEGDYRDGKPHGRFTHWDANGRSIQVIEYMLGEEVWRIIPGEDDLLI